jgi:phosphoribosylformylglycinamidine (FGAM) synthase-like amidotransferase family enzyme
MACCRDGWPRLSRFFVWPYPPLRKPTARELLASKSSLQVPVKHTEGYALWDSKHTNHDMTAFVNYKNGKGDIVREYLNTRLSG